MAKVLLVQPHYDRRVETISGKPPVPLTLIYLGTAIEDKHSVKIYDRNLNLDDAEFFKTIEAFKPNIIGFTLMTSEMIFDFLYLGPLIKEKYPKILIIAGGVHITIDPTSVLKKEYVDYIIRGEGEEVLQEFCDTLDKDPEKLKTLKNVNYNPLRPFVNLDDLKLPNYNLIDIENFGTFYIGFSRGCPGNCSFCYSCGMWGKDNHPFIRSYSKEKSIEMMRNIIEDHKVKVFSIIDDNFVPFKSRAKAICSFLEKYNVHFFCFGRADFIDDEILQALKKAGCHTVQTGFESGSQRILDLLNKKITVKQNYEAVKCCKRNKITCDASFMIGLPTETLEDLEETKKFIKTSKPDIINLKIFLPLPGAPLFDFCVENNLLKKPTTLEEWAPWTGGMGRVRHNVSKISDQVLTDSAKELWKVSFYKTKIKKFFFWIRAGEFKYALKGIKRVFRIGDRDVRLPFLGYIKTKREDTNALAGY